jgi:plasmid stabilization system protein ParE
MVAAWRVVFAADAENDLALIEAFLTKAYQDFGEPSAQASQHAATRVDAIIANAERLAVAPIRGTGHDDLLPGLRHLALDQAIYWFLVCEEEAEIRVLAVFFGGQDHQRHMLVRLLGAGR